MTTRRRKQGPVQISSSELRRHCVSVRLNDSELDIVNKKRGALARGEWFRDAFLDKLQPVKTPLDLERLQKQNELYMRLNKLLGAIGSIAKFDRRLTQEQQRFLSEIRVAINELQDEMIGSRS